ncbi:hypothetical protein PVAP13_8KG005941 [Panicum virgatum]|uniref:Uncharacterized protein n=1 Tax=Panicum virgatum TaxID=38727 RepID=A0A8T0PDS2_PANVG|nr:hypothetical protein PVAP13_8KG005941 [Panicum virgatum]
MNRFDALADSQLVITNISAPTARKSHCWSSCSSHLKSLLQSCSSDCCGKRALVVDLSNIDRRREQLSSHPTKFAVLGAKLAERKRTSIARNSFTCRFTSVAKGASQCINHCSPRPHEAHTNNW